MYAKLLNNINCMSKPSENNTILGPARIEKYHSCKKKNPQVLPLSNFSNDNNYTSLTPNSIFSKCH